jgi:hypothetical protein
MRRPSTGIILALLVGVVIGASTAFAWHVHWRTTCVGALKNIHFLIREGDTAVAKQMIDRYIPRHDRHVSLRQIRDLCAATRQASLMHVISEPEQEKGSSNQQVHRTP